MPEYLFEFEAHIDERKRPENFPRTVFVRVTFPNIESDAQLKVFYNDYFTALVRNPGITIYPDGESIDTSPMRFDQRIFVPLHMITYFHGRVKLLTPPPENKNPTNALLEPSNPEPEKKTKEVIQ